MLLPPAARTALPTTINGPLCVSAPLVVTLKLPVMAEAAKFKALMSTKVTSLPEDTETVLKLFAALVSEMLPPVAFKVAVPAAVIGPVCVIGPLAVIVSAPLEVVPGLALALPIEIAFACCQAISPPVKLTLLKLLPALSRAMLPRFPAVPPRSVTVNAWPGLRLTDEVCAKLWVSVTLPVKAGDAVVTLTVPPKLFPVLDRLTADGRIGAPAKVAWVPVKLTVMFPEAGSGNALRFVSDASTNVEPVPPLNV